MPLPYKPRAGETYEPHEQVPSGQHIAVYQSDDCTRRLTRHDRIRSSGIPIQLTERSVEIRDGSAEFPIQLPALQKTEQVAMPFLLGMLADGTIVAWNLSAFTCSKKIAIDNGMATIKPDYYSDLIDGNVCTEDVCSNLTGFLGYKEIIEQCPGEPPQSRIQIVKTAKICLEEVEECTSCDEIDEMPD